VVVVQRGLSSERIVVQRGLSSKGGCRPKGVVVRKDCRPKGVVVQRGLSSKVVVVQRGLSSEGSLAEVAPSTTFMSMLLIVDVVDGVKYVDKTNLNTGGQPMLGGERKEEEWG
jgi:hypothetical protein